MMRVKGLLVFVLVLLVAGTVGWQVWGKKQVEFAQIATAYSAKQICSCRFVAGREMSSCQNDFTLDISQLNISESGQTILSKAPLGMAHSKARYSPTLGCSLIH